MFLSVFNLLEALLWAVIGSACLERALSFREGKRKLAALAGAVFLIFALSDVVEATEYGPWWSRWWLFLWKAACVAALAEIGRRWLAATRSPAGPGPSRRLD
jgi:putative Ca2+/H+ antiporter (TMEM165/GDT1 family)